MILIQTGDKNHDLIVHHLRKSIKLGETNLESQFWLARELFIAGDYSASQDIFSNLRNEQMANKTRYQLRGIIEGNSGMHRGFDATVTRVEADHCFTKVDEFVPEIHCGRNKVDPEVWPRLHVGKRVKVTVGFSFRGPAVARMQ